MKKTHDCPRTFEGLRDYLAAHNMEGIVFWLVGKPMCKIKRSDFGSKWPGDEGGDGVSILSN